MTKSITKYTGAWIALGAIILVTLSWAPERAFAIPDRFVDDSGNDQGGANTCVNPLQPCKTIVHAISQATAGQTIFVGAGTYTDEKTANDEKGILIEKDLTILGAGAGLTIVQADVTPGTATHRVFTIVSGIMPVHISVKLSGMTIRYGRAVQDGYQGGFGGGVLALDGLQLTNSHVTMNMADSGGGIAFSAPQAADFDIFASRVTDNVALAACTIQNCDAAAAACWRASGGE